MLMFISNIFNKLIVELSKKIFAKDQNLENISGEIGENFTGQWTIEESNEQGIPMGLLDKSLRILSATFLVFPCLLLPSNLLSRD